MGVVKELPRSCVRVCLGPDLPVSEASACYLQMTFDLTSSCLSLLIFYFSKDFLEEGREGERQGEKHQCVVASCTPPTGNLACNPGMCPDWASNQ